ncbi:MAG TPA: uroporphyrinogen-III synthase [Methanomicrobiales archaeon]|nr:uroporphyrinogen-III synthase [Methanomicrobiales archaeon]
MRIAITRIPGKGAGDPALCTRFGHECYTVSPLGAEVYSEKIREFADAVNRGEFDCIFFTSALPAQLIGPIITRQVRVVAIGPQTAKTLEKAGIATEMLPTYYSRDFAPYLGTWLKGRRIGIPRADVENAELIESIRAAGGSVEEVRCYALTPTGVPLDLNGAEAVLFTSAMSFEKALWEKREGLLLLAIGDRTAEAMLEKGVLPDVVGDGSLAGTLEALNRYLEHRK